jgi:hypothetical protein
MILREADVADRSRVDASGSHCDCPARSELPTST